MMRILRFFTHPLLIGSLGLGALSLVVWYVGPLLAIGGWRPLESVWVRALLIGLFILIFVLRRLWRWWRTRSASKRLVEGLTKSPAAAAAGPSRPGNL